jgi:basic amino acid/polyamine antiporter, APA family
LVIGVAQIIGAGIFIISGVGVQIAGPGIILSFLLAGSACTLAALCYAELACNDAPGRQLSLPAASWWRLGLRLIIGLPVYFPYALYSSRKSTSSTSFLPRENKFSSRKKFLSKQENLCASHNYLILHEKG